MSTSAGEKLRLTNPTRAIALLRKQLGDDRRQPKFIETVPTIGYRFIASVVERTASDTNVPAETQLMKNSRE